MNTSDDVANEMRRSESIEAVLTELVADGIVDVEYEDGEVTYGLTGKGEEHAEQIKARFEE